MHLLANGLVLLNLRMRPVIDDAFPNGKSLNSMQVG